MQLINANVRRSICGWNVRVMLCDKQQWVHPTISARIVEFLVGWHFVHWECLCTKLSSVKKFERHSPQEWGTQKSARLGALGLLQKCQAALGFKIVPSCECGPSVHNFEPSGCLTLLHGALGHQCRADSQCRATHTHTGIVGGGLILVTSS